MISLTKVSTPKNSPRKTRISADYYQVSPKIGIKLGGCDWPEEGRLSRYTSRKKLSNSSQWSMAKKEFRIQLKAYNAGLAPKPHSLTPYRFENKTYGPCLKMEHLESFKELDDLVCKRISEVDSIRIGFNIFCKLWQAGILHHDLHLRNIMVNLDSANRVRKVYAIDFEAADTFNPKKKASVNLNEEYEKFGFIGPPKAIPYCTFNPNRNKADFNFKAYKKFMDSIKW